MTPSGKAVSIANPRIVRAGFQCFDNSMKTAISMTAAMLLLAGCAAELVVPEDGALAVIPHEVASSGHVVVETRVNGRGPFRFALDTGASISVLFDHGRAAAGVSAIPGEHVRVLGMTGTGLFPVADVAEILVGSESWVNARVALLPDSTPVASQIDGILGLDFLSRYAVWYSQRERAVRLYPREIVAERSYLGWNSIPLYEMPVGDGEVSALVFYIRIEAIPIPTVFDLGATVNLMNRRAARRLDVPIRRPRDIPNVWGVTGKTTVLTELIVWRMRIADMYWRNRRFMIDDFPIFEALGIDNRPAAVAGTSLFRSRDFIIDFDRMRLLVRARK